MTRYYEAVRETVRTRTLANGLRVCYLEKAGFSRTFAMLATDFGSCDADFTANGRHYTLPAGVAHFLEHKMFEDEDGNALQKFAATGASPNAFTSRTMTAYHFSCTDRFQKNLEILLKFVYTPYFTPENVAKERGIIAQEIGMLDDTPSWRAYGGLYEALYREHPIRVSIAGSRESIAEITPELLYDCHRTFYSPRNMALVVCGTADFDAICETAERLTPPAQTETPPVRHYGVRSDTVCRADTRTHMTVSQPQLYLGFRDDPLSPDESPLRRQLLGDLCCRILCGPTSPLYTRLFEQRLLTPSFDFEYTTFPDGAAAILGGESRDPRLLSSAVEAQVRQYAEALPEDLFSRLRRAACGMCLRTLDEPGAYARRQAISLFRGEDYASFASLLDGLTATDAQAVFARWARPAHAALSLVLPLENVC